jgi:hydroxymethylpyrimidine pyrophosphatase-like HAD family hydrolase
MESDFYVSVDFDGTIVHHAYPDMGPPVTGAIATLRDWQRRGYKIILNTMRSGKELQDAIDYIQKNGIELFAVNENPTSKSWTSSPKVLAHVYIDDAAFGCPLVYPPLDSKYKRPYVNWGRIPSHF